MTTQALSSLEMPAPRVLTDRLFTHPSKVKNIALVVAGALLVGALAQVSVPLWPVPVTGQTLGVMLVGATLGAKRGAGALAFYLLAGLTVIPWFAGFSGGPAAIFKPTFGYLLGFVLAAALIGYLAERHWDRGVFKSLLAFAIASLIPFLTGVPYLWWILASAGKEMSLALALELGFTPFIIGGIVKWLIGAAILPFAWRVIKPQPKP